MTKHKTQDMRNVFLSICLMALCFTAQAQPTTEPKLQDEVFELIDLETPAMKDVKSFYEKGDTRKAAEALAAQHSITINKAKLVLEEPIKACGTYKLKAKLGYEVVGTVSVMVVEA